MKRGAALLAFLLLFPPILAGSPELREEDFIRLRVREPTGETVLEAPLALLRSLGPTGATVPLGTEKGRERRLAVDPLVRSLLSLRPSAAEAALFTKTTDAGPLRFSASRLRRRVLRPGGRPLWLDVVLERRDLAPPRRTQVALPLAAASLAGPRLFELAGVPVDPGVLPLVEAALRAAGATGPGPLLDARAPWGRLLLTTR
ncbi:MAG: hypothetical protein ACP5VN_02530 [Acidobacteriota bacterium]